MATNAMDRHRKHLGDVPVRLHFITSLFFVHFLGAFTFYADLNAATSGNALRKITLPVGESTTLNLPPTANLNISRKGTIDIFAVSDNKWVITALRSGFIMIQISYPDEPSLERVKTYPRRIIIECVKPTTKSTSTKSAGRHAKHERAFPQPDLEAYQLHLKVISTNASQIEKLGVDYRPEKIIAFASRSISVEEVNHLLMDHHGSFDTRVEAEPMFRLIEGRKTNIALGGETAHVVASGRDSTTSDWKQNGLELNAEIQKGPTPQQRMFHYEFALRTGVQGHFDQSLNLSQMQSSVLVSLGEPVILGVLTMKSNQHSARKSFFLGQIPIIGPLLKATNHEQDAKKLIIMVNIIKDIPALTLQPMPVEMRDASN